MEKPIASQDTKLIGRIENTVEDENIILKSLSSMTLNSDSVTEDESSITHPKQVPDSESANMFCKTSF
jgi:hypothetical protein